MAIGSSLTKGMRRTWNKNKPQLETPSSDSSKTNSNFRKPSNQGDSDSSEATSFGSSVNGSTTSSGTSSTDRYSSGKQQRKTLDKLSSEARLARRKPQSRLMSSTDDDDGMSKTDRSFPVEPSDASADIQKPMVKFTRSGSLRSLKIVRKKNISSSEPKKSSNVKDLKSKKATFSSTLKGSKFPKQVEPQVGAKESDEVDSINKLCSYEHCSLHGNHQHHDPPIKRFSFLKRRSSKDQKSINTQVGATDKTHARKKEGKVTKKVSNESKRGKDADFSIEFYAKARSELTCEPNCSRDDVQLADIMFGVNGDDQDHSIVNLDWRNDGLDGLADVEGKNAWFDNDNRMSMWRLIHRHMESGLIEQLKEEEQSFFNDEDVVNQGKDVQKMFLIKNIVREAIEKILLPEEEGLDKNKGDDQTEPNQAADDLLCNKSEEPNGSNYVKKVALMRGFITDLEKAKKKLESEKRGHGFLAPEPKPEAEIVSLRSQTVSEKKNSNEWMLDYALQQVVAELAPTQKRKVDLLVKSFETVTPKLAKDVAI